MTRLRTLGLSLAVGLMALSPLAAEAKAPPAKVKQTAAPVATLAMDGARVAYASGGKVYVWNVDNGATTLVRGRYSSHTSELAIAGKRLAWITRYVVGNSMQTTERLFGGSLTAPGRLLASGRRLAILDYGVPSAWRGAWIAGAVGSGNVLAVSRWWTADDGSCSGQRLLLITPSGLRQIATGAGSVMAMSADGGRIAVLRSYDAWPNYYGIEPTSTEPVSVGIYTSTGKLLREVFPSSAKEVALSGEQLVVLTEAKTLLVYAWRTGTLVHSWPVATTTPTLQAGHLAAYGQLATYSVDPRRSWTRAVHVLQLTTGKDVVVATGRGAGYYARDAALGPRGLVYSVTYYEHNRIGQPQRGKLVLVPTARLLEAVRR